MMIRDNEGKSGRAGGVHGLRRVHGLTLIELVIVLFVLVVLVAFLFPSSGPRRSTRVFCMSNLKQAGIGFELWHDDNNNLYPAQYFTNADGSMKFANAANGFRYFLALSNYFPNPALLVCPTDKTRTKVTNWTANFSGSNISYFLGLEAHNTNANSILSGDQNITNGTRSQDGILYVRTNQALGWTPERHLGRGCILFSDGHVLIPGSQQLTGYLAGTGLATNRLLMP